MLNRAMLSLLLCFIMVAMIGCVSIPIGDGGSVKLSKDGINISGADGEDISVSVDTDSGSMSITGTDADGEQMQYDLNVSATQLPDGFPEDMPIPKEVESMVTTVNDSGNAMMNSVIMTTKGKVTEQYHIYKDHLTQAGYTITADTAQEGLDEDTKMEMLTAELGDTSFVIAIKVTGTGEFDKGEVSISIMHRVAHAD